MAIEHSSDLYDFKVHRVKAGHKGFAARPRTEDKTKAKDHDKCP